MREAGAPSTRGMLQDVRGVPVPPGANMVASPEVPRNVEGAELRAALQEEAQ